MSIVLSNEQIASIQTSITDNYSAAQAAETHLKKYNIYYTIIQQKGLINNNYHVYTDIKNFIHHYIRATYEQDFGYDVISVEKIINLTKFINNIQRESILKYTIHQLKVYGQDELIPKIEYNLKKTQITVEKDSILKNFSIKTLSRLFLLFSTYNYTSLLLSLVFVVLIVYIVLLPSATVNTAFFMYTPYTYTKWLSINHLLSVISLLTGTDDRVKVYAINLPGVILFFISKIMYFIFIASLVIKQFEKRIEI